MIDWLMTPWSGAPDHYIETAVAWHARLMVLAWGVLLPLGAFAARFFKVLPGQDWPRVLDAKPWWHAHRLLQWTGVILLSVAVVLILWRQQASQSKWSAEAHAVIGWILVAAAWLQVVAGWTRGTKGGPTSEQVRGDHYDMTPRRVRFERLHKSLGWASMSASVICIMFGLLAADAPRWMWLVLCLWWVLLGGVFTRLQRAGRCVDTYQAIWGPDPSHPGNQRRPVGWGVRRTLS